MFTPPNHARESPGKPAWIHEPPRLWPSFRNVEEIRLHPDDVPMFTRLIGKPGATSFQNNPEFELTVLSVTTGLYVIRNTQYDRTESQGRGKKRKILETVRRTTYIPADGIRIGELCHFARVLICGPKHPMYKQKPLEAGSIQ
jgi:hypothetical protein